MISNVKFNELANRVDLLVEKNLHPLIGKFQMSGGIPK